MPSILQDRVETKRFEKYRKFSIIISVILLILGGIKIFMKFDNTDYRGIGYWFDTLVMFFVFPIISFSMFSKKNEKNRIGQFIEWWDNKLVYKAKERTEAVEIPNNDIKTISIKLDDVEIITNNGSVYNISLFDYTDYDIRLRIKSNFEKYKLTS